MANETINMMELDFTGVESSNYIGEGIHLVRIKEAVFSKASTGSNQMEVTFENGDGAIRKSWFNLQPQALWKVKGFLETLGIPCDGKIKLNTRVLIGKTCNIVVEPDINDATKLTITKITGVAQANKVEAPYSAPQQVIPQAPIPAYAQPQPVAPQQVEMPAQQPAQAPTGNLPPWMSQAPAGNGMANSNLPPWMQGQNK